MRLRLAAAKLKLQQLQPSSAATKLGTTISDFTNARGHKQAPSRCLQHNQETQSSAIAHNGMPHWGAHHDSLPDSSISAVETSQNESGKATSQHHRREVQGDSSNMDGKRIHAAKPFSAQVAISRGRRGSTIFRGAESSAETMQDHPAISHAGTEQDGFCEICMESPVQTLFQPCLHTIACFKCAEKIMARQNECPMCCALLQAVLLVPPPSQKRL